MQQDTLQTAPSEVEATRQLVEKLKRAIHLQQDTNYSETGDSIFAKSASIDNNDRTLIGPSTEALETKYRR